MSSGKKPSFWQQVREEIENSVLGDIYRTTQDQIREHRERQEKPETQEENRRYQTEGSTSRSLNHPIEQNPYQDDPRRCAWEQGWNEQHTKMCYIKGDMDRMLGKSREDSPYQDESGRLAWENGWIKRHEQVSQSEGQATRVTGKEKVNPYQDNLGRLAWDRGWLEADQRIMKTEYRHSRDNAHLQTDKKEKELEERIIPNSPREENQTLEPSNTYKKLGLWRSLKDIWNQPTGLPGSPMSREAGREARSLGREQESNPLQDQEERKGWDYGWVLEDGRASRMRDPYSRHQNHHQDEYWRCAWHQGWDDQDGWVAAGAGQDRLTNPYIVESNAMALASWDRGWLRCQEDMQDCRKEGAKSRGKNHRRDSVKYSFEHLQNSWEQGWDEENAKIKQDQEKLWRQAQEKVDQQRRMEREQTEQEARLKQQLAQMIQSSSPDNDYALEIEKNRRVMREMIENKEVSEEEVRRVDMESRLDNELFKIVKRLNDLARQDGSNTPEESKLIDCYLGPSPEHFNQQELAVRRTLCLIFMRYLDHYPAEQVYATVFPFRNMIRKLLK